MAASMQALATRHQQAKGEVAAYKHTATCRAPPGVMCSGAMTMPANLFCGHALLAMRTDKLGCLGQLVLEVCQARGTGVGKVRLVLTFMQPC